MTTTAVKKVDVTSSAPSVHQLPAVKTEESWRSATERPPLRRPNHKSSWNKYCTSERTRKLFPTVSRPTKEETLKRKLWEEERRKYQESQAKLQEARKIADARKKAEAHEAKLAERRMAVLERTKRWQEKQTRTARQRETAETEYQKLIENRKKLLHEKLYEEFAKDAQKMETLKRKMYNERLGRFRTLRPKEIIDEGALSKFRVEVGALSSTECRSKSTPCKRRYPEKRKSRSQSTTRQRPSTKSQEVQERTKVHDKNIPSANNVEPLDGNPQEEQKLKLMLEEDKMEEARLRAPAKVVEEEQIE